MPFEQPHQDSNDRQIPKGHPEKAPEATDPAKMIQERIAKAEKLVEKESQAKTSTDRTYTALILDKKNPPKVDTTLGFNMLKGDTLKILERRIAEGERLLKEHEVDWHKSPASRGSMLSMKPTYKQPVEMTAPLARLKEEYAKAQKTTDENYLQKLRVDMGVSALPRALVAEGVDFDALAKEAATNADPSMQMDLEFLRKEFEQVMADLDAAEIAIEAGGAVAITIATGGSGPAVMLAAQLALTIAAESQKVMVANKPVDAAVQDAVISAISNALGFKLGQLIRKQLQAGSKIAGLDKLLGRAGEVIEQVVKNKAAVEAAKSTASSLAQNGLEGGVDAALTTGARSIGNDIRENGIDALTKVETYTTAAGKAGEAVGPGVLGGAVMGTTMEFSLGSLRGLYGKTAPTNNVPEMTKIELRDSIMRTPDAERPDIAEWVLGKKLSTEQRQAVFDAHMAEGIPTKARILRDPLFTAQERRDLMELGVCGAPPPPPPPTKKLNLPSVPPQTIGPKPPPVPTPRTNPSATPTQPATGVNLRKGPPPPPPVPGIRKVPLPPPPSKGPKLNSNPDTQTGPAKKNAAPDSANSAKIKRPDIVNTPDQKQKALFAEKMAKESGDSKMTAEIIANNLTHIDQAKFERALEESIRDFNANMGGDKPYIVIGGRSRKWVFDIAKEKGMNGSKTAIVTDSTEADVTDLLKRNPTLKDVVLIDDATYSGNQLNEITISIQRQAQLAGKDVQIHILVPFMTKYSERLARGGSVKLYKHENIQTMQEIMETEAQKRGVPKSKILVALRERYDMRGDEGRSIGLTYFDHKIPDNQSFLATKNNHLNVLRGIVVNANGDEKVIGTRKESIPFTDDDGKVTSLEVEMPIYDAAPIARQTRTPYEPESQTPNISKAQSTPTIAPAPNVQKGPPPPPPGKLGGTPPPNPKMSLKPKSPTPAATPTAAQQPSITPSKGPPPPPVPVPGMRKTPLASPAAPTTKNTVTQTDADTNQPATKNRVAAGPTLKRIPRETPQDTKFLKEYGHLTEEQLALNPQLENKLDEMKKRGLFSTQFYYEGKNQEHMDVSRSSDKLDLNTLRVSDLRKHMTPGPNNLSVIDYQKQAEGLEKSGIHELLISKPIRAKLKTGTKKEIEVFEEPGLLWGTKITKKEVEKGVYEERDIRFSEVVKSSTNNEPCVAITYFVTGYTSYKTNQLNNVTKDTPFFGQHGQDGGVTRNPSFKPDLQHDKMQDGILQYRDQAAAYKAGRPGNQISISLTLPKSEAEAMQQYFKAHPEEIRAFFLRGGQEYMLTHMPPPFAKWDEQPRPVRFRTFDAQVKTFKDEDVKRPGN